MLYNHFSLAWIDIAFWKEYKNPAFFALTWHDQTDFRRQRGTFSNVDFWILLAIKLTILMGAFECIYVV